MTAVDNKRASLPMTRLGAMIFPFRDAVDRIAVGPGFPIENFLCLLGANSKIR